MLREGRLGEDMNQRVARFTSSLDIDEEIFKYDLFQSIAHVLMLNKTKIIDKETAKKIIKGLLELKEKKYEDFDLDVKKEDIHIVIEQELIGIIGKEGEKMHTARSRNDQVATDLRMAARDKIVQTSLSLMNLISTLNDKARNHLDTVIPGYTHLQHAQPTTLGHHLHAYSSMLERDLERLLECYKRVNLSPLGSCALATTGFPIDREYTSKLLGFNGLLENSMDAVASRDFISEILSILASISINLSRIFEELILWSAYEFGLIELSDRYSSTSSIMPQKKNPDVAEICRARVGRVLGNLYASLTIIKSLPMSYNRDLQEVSRFLWDSFYVTQDLIDLTKEMIETMKVNEERALELAKSNFSTATDLADYLVDKYGLPFRTSHRLVGEIVTKSLEKGFSSEMSIEIVNDILKKENISLSREELDDIMDPKKSVSRKKIIGGPSKEVMQDSLKKMEKRIFGYTRIIEDMINSLKESEKLLEEEVEELLK
ncbi:MAG: argininosuccinate lyase [Candidatus Hydrothermarchaeota archaeon]